MYGKLQRLYPIIQNPIERFNIASGFVLQCADMLYNKITSNIFGINHTADIQFFNNIVKLQPVNFGCRFGDAVLFCKHRQHHIFFIHIRQRNKGLRQMQSLGQKQPAIRSVSVQNHRLREHFV